MPEKQAREAPYEAPCCSDAGKNRAADRHPDDISDSGPETE